MALNPTGDIANHESVQRDSLTYHSSKVAWGTAEFLAEPSPYASRAFIYLLFAFIVSGTAYSYFSQVAIFLESRGSLVTEQSVFPIRPAISFKVAKLNVKENQRVKAGDVLLVSEDQVSQKDYERLSSQVSALKGLLTADKAGKCPQCRTELGRYAQEAFQIGSDGDIREKLAGVQGQVRELATFEGQIANFDLVTATAQRQIKVAEEKLRQIHKRKAEQDLAIQVETLTNDVVSGKAQLAEKRQGLQTQIQQARDRLEVTLGKTVADLDQYRSQNTLVAPISGVVTQLKVSGAGQILPAGQDILSLVPSDSTFVAELDVANKDISEVRSGTPVKIKLDALPERDYGTVSGKVQTVPANVSGSSDAQATYRVVVQLERQSLVKNGTEYPFRLGMTLTGLVVTRYESLLRVGIKKLFNIKDDLFKD